MLLLICYIIYEHDPHFSVFPWAMLGIGILVAPFAILGGLAMRRDRKAAKVQRTTATEPAAKLPYWDKFFSSLGGCALAFACVMLPGLALLVGIVGLIRCRDPIARRHARQMTIASAILFALAILLLALALSGGSPQRIQ